jgi:hypothetical protein
MLNLSRFICLKEYFQLGEEVMGEGKVKTWFLVLGWVGPGPGRQNAEQDLAHTAPKKISASCPPSC